MKSSDTFWIFERAICIVDERVVAIIECDF